MTTSPVTPTLCRYITALPKPCAEEHSLKSALYLTAAIVSGISAAIIFGSLTAVCVGLLSESIFSGWGLLATLVGSILSMQGVETFSSWRKDEKESEQWNREVADELQKIAHWNEKDIRAFFKDNGLSADRIRPEALALLKQKNANSPLQSLLPIIARCRLAKLCVDKSQQIAIEFRNAGNNAQRSSPETLPLRDRLIQFYHLNEEKAQVCQAHYSLIGAFYLQCLINPTMKVPKREGVDIYPAISNKPVPEYSWKDRLINALFYQNAIPEVDHSLLIRQPPKEIRRLLFA